MFKKGLPFHSANEGILEKTRKIQDDHVQILKTDAGNTKNIYLIDKKNIHNNSLQVINQYEEKDGIRETRYDVTILVNGIPMVHAELKRRGVEIKEAFNQIKRYSRDSFWAASGLYEYIQIFVISNGTNTKYYSNTTRNSHLKERGESERTRSKKTSNSFEFTSFWADASNRVIPDLLDFTKTFFAKHTILNILTKYCVFTSGDLLLVMRPYQIVATEKILSKIEISNNYKKMGGIDAGGYIWHTTGSGKTLTSFKTAQLATALPYVEKVLFVVDRKDLDYQTMKEYERFEKGAADSNTSTKILQKQLQDPNTKIIITTIQKLDIFITKNKGHEILGGQIVIIFDECHRSQFGEMHSKITKSFKKYHLFGFTGTPIFAVNAAKGGNPNLKTTAQAFGDKLHSYTIVDAINDGNVLPFRIDYISTMKEKDEIGDEKIKAIDKEKAFAAEKRVTEVSKYILEHFDQKTKRNKSYSLDGQRVSGFNSIFAVSSIPLAKKYYLELNKQLKAEDANRRLKIATIFSFAANEEDPEDVFQDEDFDTSALDQSSRDFLESAIADYNKMFKTNYDTSTDQFQNYYKNLSERVKNREVDILIVVNMFLTGFDATTLNTLWVDKNLRQHGLLQAFSRTNRILNTVKNFGNIICFRNLQKQTDEAIALFGDKDANGIVILKDYDSYYNGYEEGGKKQKGYVDLIDEIKVNFPLGEEIIGEQKEKDFIKLFGGILRLKNILSSFDNFEGNEILLTGEYQDYQSIYLDLYQKLRGNSDGDKEIINEDIVFELELIRQVEINIDYILLLVAKYHESNCENTDILVNINKAINSSMQLRSKKELIENFIQSMNASTKVEEDWREFVTKQKEKELEEIIAAEKLKAPEAKKFIGNAFRDGVLKTTGTDIDKILPPVSRFGAAEGNARATKKQNVVEMLKRFFEKYFGLVHK
ncbi:MAG: type I restriction endonuclease subunit R [Anaerovoracaceae bacterium]